LKPFDRSLKGGFEIAKKNVCGCRCRHGLGMLVGGLLILANAYWAFMSWPYFIGGLAALSGLWKMVVPCNCK
jgi:uncharacterized membrane protein HdeD (DUF308 family)